jgi:hypothetical protein
MTDTLEDDVDRLLDRIGTLRQEVQDIGYAALAAEPTRACFQSVSGLLDGLNALESLLSLRVLHDD